MLAIFEKWTSEIGIRRALDAEAEDVLGRLKRRWEREGTQERLLSLDGLLEAPIRNLPRCRITASDKAKDRMAVEVVGVGIAVAQDEPLHGVDVLVDTEFFKNILFDLGIDSARG